MLYDPIIDIFYNILFTAYPIGWFATYDKERNYDELENNPKFYKKGLKNGYFNAYVFWQWYFYGLIGGTFMFWFVSLVFSKNDMEDLWLIGHTVLLCVVFVVNFKLLIKTKSHNLFSLFLFLFSNSSYILIIYATNDCIKINTYQYFSQSFLSNPTFYLLVILIVSSVMMGEYAWETSLILLQSMIEVIHKTAVVIKNKKENEKKKNIMKKDFEANRKREKENKMYLEQDMSRDFKIDFYGITNNNRITQLNNIIVSDEEKEIPSSKLKKENQIFEQIKTHNEDDSLPKSEKIVDQNLLGYKRRCKKILLIF